MNFRQWMAIAAATLFVLTCAPTAESAQLKESKYSKTKAHSGYNVSVEYPQFTGTPPALVTQLNAEIKAQVNKYFPKPEAPPKGEDAGIGPWEFSCTYDTTWMSPRFLSMHLSFYTFEGGAHGNTASVPLNYSLEPTLKPIKNLEQFFGRSVDYDTLRRLVKIELWNTLGNTDETFIDPGTKDADSFSNFNFDESGITFKFGQYQVAPYSEGMPEVTFDYGAIKSMFSQKSPVWDLVAKSPTPQRDLRASTLQAEEKKAHDEYLKRTGEAK